MLSPKTSVIGIIKLKIKKHDFWSIQAITSKVIVTESLFKHFNNIKHQKKCSFCFHIKE